MTDAKRHKPYAKSHFNFLYNLLFCDNIDLFKTHSAEKDVGPWSTLLAEQPDKVALHKIANDEANEGRVRALAFNRLRTLGEAVPPRLLLGVIVEVPVKNGLDVLAAFSEGGVRYLNHSEKAAIFEGHGNPAEGLAKELIAVSQPTINKIGPWDKDRLPPPKTNVRITFLVSDGLYFGEGPFDLLQQDEMAKPILSTANRLLQKVVECAT